jgi:uncharacterized sulfatase
VPAIIRWPGVTAPGTVIQETVSGLDWYPTLLAMAGASLPEGVLIRGHNFLPLLKGQRIPWDNDLYAEYSQHHYTRADLRTIRTPEWKLVRDFRNAGRDELYNLAHDPEEGRNLIASQDASVRKVIADLSRKLEARMRETGDAVLDASQTRAPVPPAP